MGSIYAELPTVAARGGEGKNVNWDKIEKEAEADEGGPGFFYNDCYQGVKVNKVSSSLKPQGKRNYKGDNLTDGDPRTAWMTSGIGEYFEIESPKVNIIYNGYQASPAVWKENSRVKKFKVYKNGKPICYLKLKDEMGWQAFDLPNSETFDPDKKSIFRFEIVEVYKGTKWKDVGISHIDFGGCCFRIGSVISAESENIPIQDVSARSEILSIDPDTGNLSKNTVGKVVNQKHSVLIKLSTKSQTIEITPWHPLYIKNYGFVSISRILNVFNESDYKKLAGKIEFLIFNSKTGRLEYEVLEDASVIKGEFETFSIKKLEKSKTYIVNGFISETY